MRTVHCFVAVALLAVPPTVVAGQRTVFDLAGAGSVEGVVEAPGDVLEINALQGSSRVSFKIAKQASRGGGIKTLDVWSLTLSAPLNKSADKTDLATLDGLVNSSALAFKFSRLWAPGANPAAEVDTPLFHTICAEIEAAAEEKGAGEVECDTGNAKAYLSEKRYLDFRSLFWVADHKYSLGGEARIGYEEFSFFDADSLAEEKDEKAPTSFKVFGGINPRGSLVLLSLGWEHQRGYKAAKTETVCPPSEEPDAGFLTCKTGALGPPLDDDKDLVFLETRALLGKKPIGVTLRATYDLEDDVLGLELPIFLARDDEGNLRGGVRLGWRDDTEDLSVGVFVGSAFSLF